MGKPREAFDEVILRSKVAVGSNLVFDTKQPPQRISTSCVEKVLAQGSSAEKGAYLEVQTRNTVYTLTHLVQPGTTRWK